MALNMNDGTNPPDKDLSEYAEVIAMAREAGEKIARYEAGQDAAPREEGIVLSPAQLWHKLLNAPESTRMAMLMAMVENTRTAQACFMQDHEGMGAQLEYNRSELAHAVFGSVTTDGTAQLLTAVRALRQVMVDGIAARSTAVEYRTADEPTLDEFPEEKDTRAKIGEQLKSAGIDLQSICNFEWDGLDTPLCPLGAHTCSKVNPLHADAHSCNCGASLTHEDAERLATQ